MNRDPYKVQYNNKEKVTKDEAMENKIGILCEL